MRELNNGQKKLTKRETTDKEICKCLMQVI